MRVNGIGSNESFSQKQQKPEEFLNKLRSLGIPKETIAKGPSAVKAYADENGITLPDPPKMRPPQEEGLFDETEQIKRPEPPNMEEIITSLSAMGIPVNVIQQGPEAVKEYAEKMGISLPEPPQIDDDIDLSLPDSEQQE